jgi:hypothetical protein
LFLFFGRRLFLFFLVWWSIGSLVGPSQKHKRVLLFFVGVIFLLAYAFRTAEDDKIRDWRRILDRHRQTVGGMTAEAARRSAAAQGSPKKIVMEPENVNSGARTDAP